MAFRPFCVFRSVLVDFPPTDDDDEENTTMLDSAIRSRQSVRPTTDLYPHVHNSIKASSAFLSQHETRGLFVVGGECKSVCAAVSSYADVALL